MVRYQWFAHIMVSQWKHLGEAAFFILCLSKKSHLKTLVRMSSFLSFIWDVIHNQCHLNVKEGLMSLWMLMITNGITFYIKDRWLDEYAEVVEARQQVCDPWWFNCLCIIRVAITCLRLYSIEARQFLMQETCHEDLYLQQSSLLWIVHSKIWYHGSCQ